MEPDVTQETGTEGITEHQAVEQLLSKWNKPDQEEETSEAEPADDAEPEQSQDDAEATDDAEEEAPDAGEVEIDVAGEKFKFPAKLTEVVQRVQAKAKEVEAGATRKFQEAADLRKAVELQAQSVQQLQQVAEANADLLADHKMISKRLSVLEGINVNETDAETLSRLNLEYNQLNAARGRIEAQYRTNVQSMQGEYEKAAKAKGDHAEKVLSAKIKGWGPDMQKKLAEYATSKGAPAEALNGITDAWMVEILEDAAYGHALRQSKVQVTKRVTEAPKTLAPGGAAKQSSGRVREAEALKKLQKSGSVQDAAMALLARSANRKR